MNDGYRNLEFGARGASPVPEINAVSGKSDSRRGILMLGGGRLQLPALRIAREEGWFCVLADGNDRVPGRELCDAFEHIDLKDKEGMLAMARRYHEKNVLHGVFTAATDFSSCVAFVAEGLGLPSCGTVAATNASSKLKMRQLFREHGVPSPNFLAIGPEDSLPPNLDELLELPIVVKPVDNMGARGVKKLETWADIEESLASARGFSRSGLVILEEFIEGPEFSIDSLVVDGRVTVTGFADREIRFPPYFVEIGHTIPTALPEEARRALVSTFERAVAVLGIRNGCAKGDVFLGARGPVIGEIAARLSGGYMSGWTYPLASGLEITRYAMYQALGIEFSLPSEPWGKFCAERAFISIPGVVESTSDNNATLRPDAVFWRAEAGSRVVFPRNNVEKSANVICSHELRDSATGNAESAISRLRIRLRAPDAETDEFLSLRTPRPIAFPLSWTRAKTGDTSDVSSLLSMLDPRELDWNWRSLEEGLLALQQQDAMNPENLRILVSSGNQALEYALDLKRRISPSDYRAWLHSVRADQWS